MRKKETGRSRFGLSLLIYVLLFLLVAAALIVALGLYLGVYEASRSSTCIHDYLQSGASGKLSAGWDDCLSVLDSRLQSEDEGRAFVRAKFAEASSRELGSDAVGGKRYALYDADGVRFALLTLRQTGETRWGLTSWNVEEESFDISAYTEQHSLTIPAEYSVFLGERELGREFIVESDIPYTVLESCAELVEELPTMVRYEFGPYLKGVEPAVRDASGKTVPEGKQNELYYLANCSRDEQKRLEDFALEYLDAYLPYAGDEGGNGSWQYYWTLLHPMIVHHSELEDRLVGAREGFGYSSTVSVEVVSHKVNVCHNLQDGHYLIDLEYRTETVAREGPVQEDNRVRLLVRAENGNLYAEAMYHY